MTQHERRPLTVADNTLPHVQLRTTTGTGELLVERSYEDPRGLYVHFANEYGDSTSGWLSRGETERLYRCLTELLTLRSPS